MMATDFVDLPGPSLPPPPPPPMPGTNGAFAAPHWRDTYQSPIRETAPSKQEIEKQQYAKLPDKLLNTLNKDKKPFTYTPLGVSGEKGVLDMSEIRSPRMKKRLLANLHAGEEEPESSENDEAQTSKQPAYNQSNSFNYQTLKPCGSPEQPMSQHSYVPTSLMANSFVLPPFNNNGSSSARSPSPSNFHQPKKEVRFAPSPILAVADDEELSAVLKKRKQDVEARSKIVSNEPIMMEVKEKQDTMMAEIPDQPSSTSRSNEQHTVMNNNTDNTKNVVDIGALSRNATETVEQARQFFGYVPDMQRYDNNDNETNVCYSNNNQQDKFEDVQKPTTNDYQQNNRETQIRQLENSLDELRLSNQTQLQPQIQNSNHYDSTATTTIFRHKSEEPRHFWAERDQQQSKPEMNSGYCSMPQARPKSVNFDYRQSEILKQVLDEGLQDEIDKFEKMSRETASPSPYVERQISNNYQTKTTNNNNMKPAKVSGNYLSEASAYQPYQNGRISCPPMADYSKENDTIGYGNLGNTFRCISPSIEILKKTQNTSYNYVSKPRPFYRTGAYGDDQRPQSTQENYGGSSFKPIPVVKSHLDYYQQTPSMPSAMDRFASLPRKVQSNRDPCEPKVYEDPEFGRQYLSGAGMFSQLPPKPVVNQNGRSESELSPSTPVTPPTPSRMYYGINPRQVKDQNNNNASPYAKTYEDPEVGRKFLKNIHMFSQLPPNANPDDYSETMKSKKLTVDDFYSKPDSKRHTSLPPQMNQTLPLSSSSSSPLNNRQNTIEQQQYCTLTQKNKPLTLAELRRLPPSQRPPEPTPSKYTGSNIPSRSFRLLQLITGEDIENQYAMPRDENNNESTNHSKALKQQQVTTTTTQSFKSSAVERTIRDSPQPVPSIMCSDFGTDF